MTNKKTIKERIEVKVGKHTPLSKPQKEFQEKPNTKVERVNRNNPVHVTREIGRKFKKHILD